MKPLIQLYRFPAQGHSRLEPHWFTVTPLQQGAHAISLLAFFSSFISRVLFINCVPVWCIKKKRTLPLLEVALSQWTRRLGSPTPWLEWIRACPTLASPSLGDWGCCPDNTYFLGVSLPLLTALVALQVLPGIRFQMLFCTETVFNVLFIKDLN